MRSTPTILLSVLLLAVLAALPAAVDGTSAKCPAGQYSESVRLGKVSTVRCSPCATGTFSSTAGAASCTPCAAGTFAESTGATKCKPCPIGSATFLTDEDERRPPGSAFKKCRSCAQGTSAPFAGMAKCIPSGCPVCPKGDKGDKGDTGAVGPAGPAGPTGATGAPGVVSPMTFSCITTSQMSTTIENGAVAATAFCPPDHPLLLHGGTSCIRTGPTVPLNRLLWSNRNGEAESWVGICDGTAEGQSTSVIITCCKFGPAP